jgi:GntP family gluconate:H+ symporter
VFGAWADRRVAVTVPADIAVTGADVVPTESLPRLAWAVAPIVLPVALITMNTVVNALQLSDQASPFWLPYLRAVAVLGNPQMALLLSAAVAMLTYWRHCQPGAEKLSAAVGEALMAAGVIVLITCAGGAFGGALRSAELAPAIQVLAGESASGGLGLLLLAFVVAALIKFAQGSSTAAMIVTSAMLATMLDGGTLAGLAYHPVYLATAIGSGSLVGSWMNDSGFWIFAKMGGLSEMQTLQTWTPLLALMGVVSMLMTLLLAVLLPMGQL